MTDTRGRTFEQADVEGKIAEATVAQIITTRWKLPEPERAPDRYFPAWDLKAGAFTFEVKAAPRAHEYRPPSVFVETANDKGLSGITLTKADWYVFVMRDRALFVHTLELREFIGKHRGTAGVMPVVNAGNGGKVKGWKVWTSHFDRSFMASIVDERIVTEYPQSGRC